VTSFILGRGKDFCRSCDSSDLFSALDLGDLPIANELWENVQFSSEVFPLHLRICRSCGLGQVEDVVTPSRLFRDYRYLSSVSSSFVEHAKNFVNAMLESNVVTQENWVLEIASNDGYLLQNFIENGIDVLGVEPAENIAKIAIEKGIPTLSDFFGASLASTIQKERGFPKLIIANNVMAHVPDIQDFVAGLAKISGPNTLISIENPSLINLLKANQFDTIYHEHYSYLTAYAVKHIAESYGLELFKVESLATHGGSNRYWLRLKTINGKTAAIQGIIEKEIQEGLLSEKLWQDFANRIQNNLATFHTWVKEKYQSGTTVCGFGAAAKASTLLNAARIEKNWIACIADTSNEKQGRFMPTLGIPIVNPAKMFEMSPSEIVVFPWNIKDEITNQIRKNLGAKVTVWQAVPHLEVIS
jgi:2-polyprenyl-3-methyl-5-hydroxy-6-metoxy-1,4-benzoquinol methylase